MKKQNDDCITVQLIDSIIEKIDNAKEAIEKLGGEEAINPKIKVQIDELCECCNSIYEYSNEKDGRLKNGCACVSIRQKRKR